MELDLYSLYQDLKSRRILFCYSGPIAHAGIEGVAQTLRMNLEYDDTGNATKLAVFSIFIEQVQNILNYSAERLCSAEADTENELSFGTVVIGREEDGSYFIYCGNRIYNKDIPELGKRIDEVKGLSKDELKALYKERRRMEPPPGSKGAGLGLVEIARKAGRPIEYSFRKIDEVFSFFVIKVVVGR
jgi:hypothetical protein